MVERDLTLNEHGDLTIDSFDLKLTDDSQMLPQRLRRALLLFKGECLFDIDSGIPYHDEIIGNKPSYKALRAIFFKAITSVAGVKELEELELKLDANTRQLVVHFKVIAEDNSVLKMEI